MAINLSEGGHLREREAYKIEGNKRRITFKQDIGLTHTLIHGLDQLPKNVFKKKKLDEFCSCADPESFVRGVQL